MDSGFFEVLRVLLVDDDASSLRRLHSMLSKSKSQFRVTMCEQPQYALNLIQQGQEEFDTVITETDFAVNDGFMFVQQVRCLKPNLPIILMSEEIGDHMIKIGVEMGVSDFIFKPISQRELRRCIRLQHELSRKRKTLPNNEIDAGSSKNMINDCDSSPAPAPIKKTKTRMVWSNDLHQKFVEAVNHIGLQKARPKKILELIKVEGLTIANVSSHWQKYRKHLTREEKKKLQRGI